jgi:tetratricopeptide (TPR) repeat protein
MEEQDYLALAHDLFQEAYDCQMEGDFESAANLYRRSIEAFPTAEAYTYLGWTYSFLGNLDEAIEQCKHAIEIDPGYGNAYNDIGSYLIQKGEYRDAVPWLQKAVRSQRFATSHYAHYNLGRAYVALELLTMACNEFEQALKLRSDYEIARNALFELRRKIQ